MGVYMVSILVLIKFGILNFIGYLMLFRNAEGEVMLPIVVVTLALCLFTAGACIWTLTGQNEGRISLLIILPLNILWVLLFSIADLFDNIDENDKAAVMTIIQLTMQSIFIIAIEWYLMSEKVVAYFKQDDGNKTV